jgi:hypothetical protein
VFKSADKPLGYGYGLNFLFCQKKNEELTLGIPFITIHQYKL